MVSGFFSRPEAMCDSSGRANAASAPQRGNHRQEDSHNQARGACPHTSTGALRSGAPPDGKQTDLLADDSAASAAAASARHSNLNADDGREAAILYALGSVQPAKQAEAVRRRRSWDGCKYLLLPNKNHSAIRSGIGLCGTILPASRHYRVPRSNDRLLFNDLLPIYV